MAEVLSSEEIDQLIAAIKAGPKPECLRLGADRRKIKMYDFKRPDKFSREQIRTISMIHDIFARLTTTSLSAQLRSMVFVHVASVDQLTYEEFIRSVPTPTTLAILNMDPLMGNAILEIDPTVTFSIIDRICGGSGDETKSQHELTDIEASIMEGIIVRLLGNMREALAQILDLRPRLGQIDTNPQFAQIVPPNEMTVLVTLETKIGDVEGMINICIPYLTIEPIMGKFSDSFWYYTPLKTSGNLIDRDALPVKLNAEILRRDYPLREILKWDTGTVILPLRSPAPDCCYLRIGDRRVWQCQILPDCKGFPKRISIVNYAEKPFGTEGNDMEMEKVNPLVADAVANARMRISVELGTTLKTVKEVYAFGEGTIVELDKLAGEPVDVIANGVFIAKGEVVVVDNNFGVRITEITGTSGASSQSETQQSTPEPPEPTGEDAAEEPNEGAPKGSLEEAINKAFEESK
jgi:flagellar motor switch protein FliM